ncbi:sensor histidine kinase [Pseudoflavitalea rhizosphaerae]|uniref:sensor histidine kinase n=1 Tax=Pseudoflavitalea rhizosphaerae TaxID=1884793 RepID=UPI000F8C774E|nr:ATP-binding protein [Pseudoflavitalea rhizosphaerae]
MKVVVLYSILLLFPTCILAHDSLQYTVRQYTDENGLPQNSVKAMGFDRSGFLWMNTENGVVRFDGQFFRSFNKNQLPLVSSRMSWLHPDLRTGALISVTERNQLIRMQDGQATLLSDHPLFSEVDLEPDTKDENFKTYSALGLPNVYASLIHVERYKMSPTADRYYLLTNDSVYAWDKGKMEFSLQYKSGNFWQFFLMGSRLYQIQGTQITLIEAGRDIATGELQGDIRLHPGFLNGKEKPKVYWSTCADQVFVVMDKTLYMVKPGAKKGLTTELLMREFDYEANRITTICYDTRFKRLFMGSQTRGLFLFTRKPFFTIRSGQSDADEVYYAQAELGNNRIITPQGYLFNLQDIHEVLPELNKRMKEDRSSMVLDHDKNIWVKHRMKLYCFDPEGRKLLREFSFPHNITMLYEDQDSNLIVGAKRHPAWRFSLNDPRSKPAIVYPAIKDLCYIQEEGAKRMWMGCGNGLYCIDKATGKIDSIKELSGKYIRSLYVRQEGELWVSTHEDGFYLYDGKKLVAMPMDKGGYLASAHCVIEDENGFFWITTNKGLFQTARQDLLDYAAGKLHSPYYLYYDKYTGFNTNEFNGGCQPCGLKLKGGYFSLPSLNGLVVGNPSKLVPEVPSLNLFIDRIEIDGNSIPLADTISLDKHFDFFRLFVTTPYFGNPYNRHLDFSLVKDGNAGTWLPVDGDGSIKLSSLASGSYEIRIRKANGFGANNHLVKSVLLVVPLAFYETAWFRLLIALLVIIGFFLYMRIKLRYIRRKNAQLEEKIDERTKALQATLKELQQSEESMRRQTRMQERLIAAITHDIKTPLKYLTGAARRLFESTEGEKAMDDKKRSAHLIYESGYRMYHLTDNLLQYIKLNSSQGSIVMDKLCLNELVENKLQIFNEIAAEQSTRIENNIPRETYVLSNHHLLGIIVHNLIDNAVKATFEGVVKISATTDEDTVSILVEDSGFGMNKQTQEWCNDEAGTAVATNGVSSKSGLGLIIVKDLVAQMQGRVRVRDGKEGGTVVELIFTK